MTQTPQAVYDLSEPYRNYLIGPQPGEGICRDCLTFIEEPHLQCIPCEKHGDTLAAASAISYSHQAGQLHHALRTYKSPYGGQGVKQLQYELTAVLWRHLLGHEPCLTRAAGVDDFPIVTTVPSTNPERDPSRPLPTMIGEWMHVTRARYQRLLVPTGQGEPHRFHAERFTSAAQLGGEPILLIDDTWTSGANLHSAAIALTAAGAGPIAALAIGRYIRTNERDHQKRLDSVPGRSRGTPARVISGVAAFRTEVHRIL